MCGIFGCFHRKNLNIDKNNFLKNLDLLSKRGPDSTGYKEFKFENSNLKFGHKRLSILDLSNNGNQPMNSSNSRYSIVFNGEIYNHLDLRFELSKKININWKSSCDTETLLEYISNYGLLNTLIETKGMFAFGLLDVKKNILYFVRDFSGEKPLYLMLKNNFLGFSSTLQSLMSLSPSNNFLNYEAISKYLNFNYIPSPLTIFNSCFKLLPGSILSIDLNIFELKNYKNFDDLISSKGITFKKYWEIKNQNNLIENKESNESIVNITENYLEKSINSQLISDAPLGVFLSGGIDSSLIVSLLSKSNSNIKTFNMGFDFGEYDESNYASEIAKYFNTNHTKYNCTKKDFLDIISEVPSAFDEPFADSSQIPTMLLSKSTKNDVKVVLGGDGGDELFGGYNRYLIANKYWRIISLLPLNIRKLLIYSILKFNITSFRYLTKFITFILNDKTLLSNNPEKIFSKLSSIETKLSFYKSFVTEWKNDSNIIDNFNNNKNNFEEFYKSNYHEDIETLMMKSDFISYLPDDILTKVDRSSMYYGLEARSPFLDKNIVDFAINLPVNYKIKDGKSKFVLKEILSKYIPKKYFIRPKHGFALPIKHWLKTDLRDWTLDILSKDLCNSHGVFNYEVIDRTYKEHMLNGINNEHKLWSILQFNQWFIKYKKFISL